MLITAKGLEMEKFTKLSGVAAPLPLVNVDTDMIIPKQFLKTTERDGLAAGLFHELKTLADGSPNPDFVLNKPQYQTAGVLIAGENFGCGSSREHAVWALQEYGFRAVIAPSFADIFHGNCFKNGLLPIVLDKETIDEFFGLARGGLTLSIDLQAQEVRAGEAVYHFDIEAGLKEKMLKGLDDIAMTLNERALIETFEAKHRDAQPWLFQR